MAKKIILGMLIIGIIGTGVWLYFNYVYSIPIKDILENPRKYDEKVLTISGQVTDRVSLLFLKYFKLRDENSEIIVVTLKTLPPIGKRLRVKGKVVEAFTIGNEQLLVFVEEDSHKNEIPIFRSGLSSRLLKHIITQVMALR